MNLNSLTLFMKSVQTFLVFVVVTNDNNIDLHLSQLDGILAKNAINALNPILK